MCGAEQSQERNFNISAGIKKKGNSLSIILSSLKKKKKSGIWKLLIGHLSCFHVPAVVYSAVMNTGVHVSF